MISKSLAPFNEDSADGDFWDNLRRKGHGYPEQDLLLAVLKGEMHRDPPELQRDCAKVPSRCRM